MKNFTIRVDGLDTLIDALAAEGFTVVGPVVRDGAITYRPIASTSDMPTGIGARLAPGGCRLTPRGDGRLFGYPVGPGSLKEHLFPSRRQVWTTVRDDDRIRFVRAEPDDRRLAVIGARPCDLAAVAVQDRTLLGGPHRDPHYAARRSNLFVVAVHCTEPGDTCFCASMGTGPRAAGGFDLALTEISGDHGVIYVGEVGSDRGAAMLHRIPVGEPTEGELVAAAAAVGEAVGRMGRTLDADDLPALLRRNLDHPRWAEVATRCLACGNCTMVCPTCFCTTVEDGRTLDGIDTRTRRWDTCFSLDYSYMAGTPVRSSIASRYRQWMTHKLSTWVDQFGMSGCVGCGRCITWCPVGIDITEEAAAIRASEVSHG